MTAEQLTADKLGNRQIGVIGRQGKIPHIMQVDAYRSLCKNKDLRAYYPPFPDACVVCPQCATIFLNEQNTEKETPEMAKTTAPAEQTEITADAPAEQTEERELSPEELLSTVTADVENIIAEIGKLNKTQGEQIKALAEQGDTEAAKITEAVKRVPLTMKIKEAVSLANARAAKAEIVKRTETTSVEQIANYKEIIDNTASMVAEGIRSSVSEHEQAYKIAEAILQGRLGVFDNKGFPDLKGTRDASKKLSEAIYNEAMVKLHAAEWKTDTADYETLRDALISRVKYQMTAVLPNFCRAMDDDREAFAEHFPMLVEKITAEMPPSEILFKHYRINPKSRAERAAEARAKKALEPAKEEPKALTDGTEPEGDESGEGGAGAGAGGGEEQTHAQKTLAEIAALIADLTTLEPAGMSPEEITETQNRIIDLTTAAQTWIVKAGQAVTKAEEGESEAEIHERHADANDAEVAAEVQAEDATADKAESAA